MNISYVRRRLLVVALATTLVPTRHALAAEDPAAQRVQYLYTALLDTMKRAQQLGVSGRYEKLAPVIREVFDLPAMTRIAVGPAWTSIPAPQQQALIENFSRMTTATYASRFDGYSGERFEVEPMPEARGRNKIVHSQLLESSGKATTLNYLMHEVGSQWKIADVYLSGTVSELATRRSEFGSILKSGGADALIDSLKQRTEKLMK